MSISFRPLAALALLVVSTRALAADDVAPAAIEKTTVVAAPRGKAFDAWTTAEGLRSFLAPASHVELRLGGPYEIYFMADAPEGGRGTAGCKVLSFLPGRMLSFTWNAPPTFPAERAARTFVVLEFEDAEGGSKTSVKLTHSGFGKGGKWAEVRDYFDKAWSHVLETFAASFGAAPRFPKDAAAPAAPGSRPYFVSFLRPKDMAALNNLTPEGREAFSGHVAHLQSLQAQGRLVLAGPSLLPGGGDGSPFGGPAIGLVVFAAKDEAEAKTIAGADPMVKAGLFEMTLRPFNLAFERP